MAQSDLQTYLQERLATFDSTLDVTSGSPLDVQVIQPLLRRLGSDPFSVDIGTFIQDRINQEFPELATKEGDAITDILIKLSIVLLDPIVRENFRVKQNLSFKDPATLTLEEADSLGANLFAQRETGNKSRVRARIYFAQPQNVSVSPANYVSSKTGLHFLPTENQSISPAEMLFNLEGPLYYFDVDLIAERPGDQYNIGPDELTTIANLGSAVRITNKLRARFGLPAEDAIGFIGRVEQDLTERSLVTERGITAKIAAQFTEVTRLAVTGFNDPEMQRDVLTGGGLGPIIAGGVALNVIADGENKVTSRRFRIDTSTDLGVDFTSLIGPSGVAVSGFTMTIHNGFPTSSLPIVRDLTVRKVVDATTLDLEEQVLNPLQTDAQWVLRKNTLTLSGIPGGILFPDTPAGTLSVPPNKVHIGGCTDMYIRGADFDSASLVINDLVDDEPELKGIDLEITSGDGHVLLRDLKLGAGGNYSVGDATYEFLANCIGLTVQIRDVPVAGSYRILGVTQTDLSYPELLLTPAPTHVTGAYRWKMLDVIDVDLLLPKESKISGSDLTTVQGVTTVTTLGGTDFDTYGVAADDVLRILSGSLIVGDYTVKQVLSPLFTNVEVDRPLPATVSNAKYVIFRPNKEGGVNLPFVRIDSIDLLDTSSQPVGSKVPYAKPVDIRSRSFANAAHGIKADVRDATLGVVTKDFASGVFGSDLSGLTLIFSVNGAPTTVTFAASTINITVAAARINATYGSLIAVLVNGALGTPGRIGLLPVAANVVVTGGTAMATLFAGMGVAPYSSRDIRSAAETSAGGWDVIRPRLDVNSDVAQVLDGLQIGFYDQLVTNGTLGTALATAHDFSPEVGRHVQVGSRSLGSVRCYFLEPTSIEFGPRALLTLTNSNGSEVSFFPDPTLTYQRIPALPSGVKPKDGVTTGSDHLFTTAAVDFIQKGIVQGDILVVDYIPIAGSALADPVAGLALKTVRLSIGGGIDKVVTFVNDSSSIPTTDVTRAGVANQINRVVGQTICSINASNALEFEADTTIIVRAASATGNSYLGFSTVTDTSNVSPGAGRYVIAAPPTPTTLDVGTTLPAATRQQFKVFRAGIQRICATQMSAQVAETGLYYFDVELLSQGSGDQYNIAADLQLTAEGYAADGYWLTTDDSNLSFSGAEKPKIHFSRSILEVGTTDDPDNATQLSGQNIQINYDRSAITQSIQNFTLAETERVITQSPLARHLVPYFVRLDAGYVGGSKESDVTPILSKFINGLFPKDFLEVSDVEKILLNKGATSIDNPMNLIAIIHNVDRTVTSERSQDKINTGRLAAFIPDVINLKRRVS